MRASFTLIHLGRPYTHNKLTSWHYHQRANVVREWRHSFKILAKAAKVPLLTDVEVIAQPHLRGRRWLDLDAPAPAVKAAVDGLVDAGVLEDDRPPHYTKLTLLPAVMESRQDAFVITVIGDTE